MLRCSASTIGVRHAGGRQEFAGVGIDHDHGPALDAGRADTRLQRPGHQCLENGVDRRGDVAWTFEEPAHLRVIGLALVANQRQQLAVIAHHHQFAPPAAGDPLDGARMIVEALQDDVLVALEK